MDLQIARSSGSNSDRSAKGAPTVGTITKLSPDRGSGLLRDDAGRTRFFHRTALTGISLESLHMGQSVAFEPQDHPKGLRALNVRLASATEVNQSRRRMKFALLRQRQRQSLAKLQEEQQCALETLYREQAQALAQANPTRQKMLRRRQARATAKFLEQQEMAIDRLKTAQARERAEHQGKREPTWWELAESLAEKRELGEKAATEPGPYSVNPMWTSIYRGRKSRSARTVQGGGIETNRRRH
jgi:CspA family cold shock protein